MERFEVSEKIKALGIPRATVAAMAGCYKSDLSAWLNHGSTFAPDKITRVVDIVTQLDHAVSYFPGVSLDLRDPLFVRRLINAVKQAEAAEQAESFAEALKSISEMQFSL